MKNKLPWKPITELPEIQDINLNYIDVFVACLIDGETYSYDKARFCNSYFMFFSLPLISSWFKLYKKDDFKTKNPEFNPTIKTFEITHYFIITPPEHKEGKNERKN